MSKHLHLVISLLIVVPTAVIYGAAPSVLLPHFLEIPVTTTDLANMLRAVMCLYLGVCAVWSAGILKPRFWRPATLLNILFMLSLAAGRLLSMVFDELPSEGYIFGFCAELILGTYSCFQLKKYDV